MSTTRQAVALVIFLAVTFSAAGVGSLATTPNIATWYAGFAKPYWKPPNRVFGPLWTLLHISMAVAAWLVWRQGGLWQSALALFAFQLVLNAAWSWLFFGYHPPRPSFIKVGALLIAIAATTLAFSQCSFAAGVLMLPCLGWVAFASALGITTDSQTPTTISHEAHADPPRWRRAIIASKATFLIAAVVLCFDVVFDGSYVFSIEICPIWFLVSVVKNLIWRPGWGCALFRIAMPVLVLGVTITNDSIQWKIAETNAERVIKACEEFHIANGRYPKALDELVPGYLPSVPRAKYCLNMFSRFLYFNYSAADFLLVWQRMGWYRKTYNFGKKRYGHLD